MVKVVTYKLLTPYQLECDMNNFAEIAITDNEYCTTGGHLSELTKDNLITVYRSLHQESPIDHSLAKFGLIDSDISTEDSFEIIIVVPTVIDNVFLFINKSDKYLLDFIPINELLSAVHDYLAKYFLEIYVGKYK